MAFFIPQKPIECNPEKILQDFMSPLKQLSTRDIQTAWHRQKKHDNMNRMDIHKDMLTVRKEKKRTEGIYKLKTASLTLLCPLIINNLGYKLTFKNMNRKDEVNTQQQTHSFLLDRSRSSQRCSVQQRGCWQRLP